METEYQVLTHLHENENTSQRKISKHTGLSLGAVNILIQKMARKGLIKIEKLNSRTVRYILTPRGMKEKTRLTYHFVRRSYHQILHITNAVEKLIEAEMPGNGSSAPGLTAAAGNSADVQKKTVVLFGPADEIEAILKITLRGLNIKPVIKRPEEDNFKPLPDQLILTWREEDEENLPVKSGAVNVMNLV